MTRTYLWNRNRLTDIENRLVVAKGEGDGGGKDWEFGISRCKLLGWPKTAFGFFRNILRKNPNEFFGQPSILYIGWINKGLL